jgi:Transposase domain (DUF772)
MRGDDQQTGWMFSYVSPEERVPADHPLRTIRRMTDAIFDRLSPQFGRLYSRIGRPSIPPEKLLRALLLQRLYTVRSERLLMEQLKYNLLFRWFVGLRMDDRAIGGSCCLRPGLIEFPPRPGTLTMRPQRFVAASRTRNCRACASAPGIGLRSPIAVR